MKSVRLTVLIIALVLQLAFAAPFICGQIGVATLGGLPNAFCPAHYTCSIQCKCSEKTRFVDIQTSPAWESNEKMQSLWNRNCYNKKCTCAEFYQLLRTPVEQIQFQTNNLCGCGRGASITPIVPKTPKGIKGLEVEKAESLEVRAAELEQNALQLESQAESLELE
jgi:hypothetical protein